MDYLPSPLLNERRLRHQAALQRMFRVDAFAHFETLHCRGASARTSLRTIMSTNTLRFPAYRNGAHYETAGIPAAVAIL